MHIVLIVGIVGLLSLLAFAFFFNFFSVILFFPQACMGGGMEHRRQRVQICQVHLSGDVDGFLFLVFGCCHRRPQLLLLHHHATGPASFI
jgi:hypothetical protein